MCQVANYSKDGKIYTLTKTRTEGVYRKWVNCLALLDSGGNWQLSMGWRTNHAKKAHKELILMGYTLIEESK